MENRLRSSRTGLRNLSGPRAVIPFGSAGRTPARRQSDSVQPSGTWECIYCDTQQMH